MVFIPSWLIKNPQAASFAVADEPLCVDIIDPEAIYQAVKDKGVKGIVSMAEAGVVSAAIVSERLGLQGVTASAAVNATSKANMRRAWETMPEYSVGYHIVHTLEEAENAAKALNTLPLICKPDKTFGGSRGVSKIESLDQVKEAFDFAFASGMNGKVIIEECATGEEYSCEVLAYHGKTSVLCKGRKVKSPMPFRVDLSVQYGQHLTEAQDAAIADMCHKAVAALGIVSGVAHIEFALTTAGPKIFELGARCGGGHTPIIAKHVSGVNEFVEYCRLACGDKPESFNPLQNKGADYRFVIFPAGRLASVSIPQDLYKHKNILDIVVTATAGDTINTLRTTSDRAGAIVTIADSMDEAITAADEACRRIEVTYEDGSHTNAIVM